MKVLKDKAKNKTYLVVDSAQEQDEDWAAYTLYELIHINKTDFTDEDVVLVMVSQEDSPNYIEETIDSVSLHVNEFTKYVDGKVKKRMRSFHIIPHKGLGEVASEGL